jgi:iron complex outermembrane recepter protein
MSPFAGFAKILSAIFCMCLLLQAGATAKANGVSEIRGFVEDATGASLAGVRVTLRNATGYANAQTTTDAAGHFSIFSLPPGEYLIEAQRKMFETSRSVISVSAATPTSVRIVMKVAPRRETVEVVQPSEYAVIASSIGTKTDTPILETPVSVQTVPQKVIEDQQVTRIEQAVRNVSGVYRTNAWLGGFADQFVIRGFSNYEILYRDGFRMDTGYVGKHDTANIEQIEVVKGPASILFGRMEPGGVVNYTTKKPLPGSHYAIQQQIGSFDSYRTSLDATGPLTKEKLAYRFNASYEHNGSFREFVGDEGWFLSPVVQWKISPATELRASWEYFNNKTTPDNIGLIPYGHRPLSGVVNVNGVLRSFPIGRNLGEPTDFQNATQHMVNATFSHLFKQGWQVNSIFNAAIGNEKDGGAFGDFSTDADITLGTLNRTNERSQIGLASRFHTNTYASEINVLGKFDTWRVKHSLLLGADYYLESPEQTCCGINGFLLDDINIFAPAHGVTIGPVDSSQAFTLYGRTSWYGLYLQDQIQLPKHFFVLAGARYDRTRGQVSSIYGFGSESDHRTSPRVGLLWHPREWLSLYGSYVENFGQSNGSFIDRSNRPLFPETARQWELGVKTAFGRRVVATLSYFDLTKQNIAVSDPQFPDDHHHALTIGKANSRGVEVDMSGAVRPNWNVILAYAYTDPKIVKDLFFGTAGNRLANVPKHGGRLWMTYSFLGGEPRRLTVGGGVTARSVREGNMSNEYLLPGFATADMMSSYIFPLRKSNLTLQVNVSNLLNRKYFEASGEYLRGRIVPGSPVSVVSAIRVEF